MYGQSCMVTGCGGGSRAVQGGLPLLGTQGDLPRPLLCGDLPGALRSFAMAVHCAAKALVAAADEEQRLQGLAPPGVPDVGVVRLVLPGVRVVARVVRGGGWDVVGGEEGVGAVDQPGVDWCVVVGGGEGVVPVVHEGHVRDGAGCWLLGLGMSPMTWFLKLLREFTRSTHVLLSQGMMSVGGWAMLGSW